MADKSAVLVCTVGGSHQPILTALQARRWDLVIFVCTAETERSRGSVAMVEQEIVVTRSTQAPVETLPPHFLQERDHQARAGCPDRMAECNRAAVDIEAARVQLSPGMISPQ